MTLSEFERYFCYFKLLSYLSVNDKAHLNYDKFTHKLDSARGL